MSMKQFMFFALLTMSHLETVWAQTSLTLPDFLKQVASESPDIRSESASLEERTADSEGIRLSPPMFGIMNINESGQSIRGIEASQEIPFPTKIASEKTLRKGIAESQLAFFRFKRQSLLLDARLAYFDFWQSYELSQLAKEKRDWLKGHAQIARTAARSDSAGQLHLLSAEAEIDLLEIEILNLQLNLNEKRQSLRIFSPKIDDSEWIPTVPPVDLKVTNLKPENFEVVWRERELQNVAADVRLQKQEYLPDLFWRFRSTEGSLMTPKSDELMIGVSLPFLFFWQPNSKIKSAKARESRAEAELMKSRLISEIQMGVLLKRAESLLKQTQIFKERLLPRAHKRMKIVENQSARTMQGLDEHRMVMLDYIELRQKEILTRFELEKVITELMRITGSEVAQ